MDFITLAQKIVQAADDLRLNALAARTAEREAGEIIDAIRSRIESEKTTNAAEIERLKRAIADVNRTETARKMDHLTLERIEAYVPEIHQEEEMLFKGKVEEARQSLADWRKTESDLRGFLSEAKKTLDKCRPGKITSGIDISMTKASIDETVENFEIMRSNL